MPGEPAKHSASNSVGRAMSSHIVEPECETGETHELYFYNDHFVRLFLPIGLKESLPAAFRLL